MSLAAAAVATVAPWDPVAWALMGVGLFLIIFGGFAINFMIHFQDPLGQKVTAVLLILAGFILLGSGVHYVGP